MSRNLLDTTTEQFREWAKDNGVDLEYEDDWGAWWECWVDGYVTAIKCTNTKKEE